jgi:UMF1 family MFS transporter
MATFVVSNVAYSLGESLAGAFLPEISTPATIGRISGFGWGLGYLGGLASLLAVMPLLAGGFTAANLPHLRAAWLVTAAFFGLGALPTFLLLRERAVRPPRFAPLGHARAGLARLAATLHSLRRLSELARFLAVFFAFSCGLTAVIAFSSIFAERTLGFGPGDLVILFMVLQLSAAAGAVLFGWVQDRVGAVRTIQATLVLWLAVCAGAFFCHSRGLFWGIGLVAGLGLGSAQSASRALVGLLAPAGKEGELFGFWGLAGKAAYALGPLAFGALSAATGSQRVALLSTAAFFLVGLTGMAWVDEARGVAQARAWEARPATPPATAPGPGPGRS